MIARAIGDWIVALGWPVGAVLGSELELCARFDVSRAVLREAVRLVEHQTVAGTRRGPGGGLVVREPDTSAVLKAVMVYLESVDVTVSDIFEARTILEPLAAGWAAAKVDEESIVVLRETLEHEHAVKARELASPNQELIHQTLASMAANPVVEMFVEVLTDLTARYARTVPSITDGELKRASDGVTEAHEAIIRAVIAGDAGLAEQRSVRHLEAMAEWLASKYGGASTARQARIRARRRIDPPRVPGSKLAEHVADRIRDELVRVDLPVGQSLGSEVELLEKYGTSRAVMREAVRILEHHSVARMRRGPGGGLIRTHPDPSASVESMALLLDFKGVTLEQVMGVRNALEVACIVRVSHQIGTPEIRERVSATQARLEAGRVAPIDGALPEFHGELAELAGNPLLSLFVQILGRLSLRHLAEPVPERQLDAERGSVAAHIAICSAILAGDSDLARHRMVRHLAALDAWWCDRPPTA